MSVVYNIGLLGYFETGNWYEFSCLILVQLYQNMRLWMFKKNLALVIIQNIYRAKFFNETWNLNIEPKMS